MTSSAEWIGELWRELRAETIARIDELQRDVAGLSVRPSADVAQRSQMEAHRLAGSLGSYGLTGGSLLARELEVLLIDRRYSEAASVVARIREITGAFLCDAE